MKPLPLKWRVSLLVAGAILLGMGFAALTGYSEMLELLMRNMDRTLDAMARSTMKVLAEAPGYAATDSDVRSALGAFERRQNVSFRIWYDAARDDLLSSPARSAGRPETLSAPALSHVKAPALGESRFFSLRESGEHYRAVWMRSSLGPRTVNVAVALSSHAAYDALEEVQDGLFYAVGGAILITIVATTLLVGVGLRPIRATARALSAVTHRNVGDARLDIERTPQELQPFVREVSDMRARLARAMAEQKRFVSDASHELRTPLSVARSTIDATLVKGRTPEQYRKALCELREDLDRMGALVEDLLVMARLDETAPAKGAQTFDLADLIEELAGVFNERAARRGGRLSLNLAHVGVSGDHTQVARLFSNLLDNALRHGPGEGTVSVTISRPDAGWVEVQVHDQGGRIPPEALPHLFDRFYRADGSRARSTGGVGLGLSIAREIALQHGGDITASSTPEDGTCFTVKLPAA